MVPRQGPADPVGGALRRRSRHPPHRPLPGLQPRLALVRANLTCAPTGKITSCPSLEAGSRNCCPTNSRGRAAACDSAFPACAGPAIRNCLAAWPEAIGCASSVVSSQGRAGAGEKTVRRSVRPFGALPGGAQIAGSVRAPVRSRSSVVRRSQCFGSATGGTGTSSEVCMHPFRVKRVARSHGVSIHSCPGICPSIPDSEGATEERPASTPEA